MIRIQRTWLTALVAAVACAQLAPAAEVERVVGPDAAPDVAAIRAAARRTEAAFKAGSASWTAVHTQGARELRMDVISTPQGRWMLFSLDAKGERPVVTVVERDGLWYVTDPSGVLAKCRPHEYPFTLASFPLFQQRSDILLLTHIEREHLGTFESRDGGRATYRSPLNPTGARQLELAVAQADAMAAKAPGGLPPETAAQVETMRELLRRGLPTVVDLEHGIALQHGSANLTTRIENFRWLDAAPAGVLDVEGFQWEDRSAGPLGDKDADPNEFVMLLHTATWRPGMPRQDADARILDLRTGRLWRVPYPGVGSMPGCFAKDRQSVIVTGAEPESSSFRLYHVDLRDGATRQLGGDALSTGLVGPAALSPDGKTLALAHIPSIGRPGDRQVYFVDVESGEARPVGKPIDVNALSWLPDGKGLVVVRADWPEDDPKKPWVGMICRMNLDGAVTELRPGAGAVVLDDRRILFEEQAADVWKTCDFDGKNVKLFGNGLKGYFFPAPSPDGKRIIFIRNAPDRGPTPFLFHIDGTGGTPATATPGLWGTPKWR